MKALLEPGTYQKGDERILGQGDFVAQVLADAEAKLERKYRLISRTSDYRCYSDVETGTCVMRILVCIETIPQDCLDGYNLRIYHLVKALSLANLVTVVVKNTMNGSNLWTRDGSENIEIIDKISQENLDHAFRKPKPFLSVDNPFLRYCGYDHTYHNLIRQATIKYRPDIVMTFSIGNSPYLLGLKSPLTVCDVIDSPTKTNILHYSSIWKLTGSLKTILVLTWMYYRVLAKCDILLAVTDEDAAEIRKYSRHRNVFTLTNGVDSDYFAPRKEGLVPIVVFTGNMDFTPNVNAAIFFAGEIWGNILRVFPSAHFLIVGRNPVFSIRKLASVPRNIAVTGFVDDIRDYIGKAWVVVAPMIDGTGIKNKILEAWSMAKPVVASKLATQGLHAHNNQNIIISDSPEEISNRVIDLLAKRSLRAKIGVDARKHVMANYTWQSQAEKLIRIFGMH